MAMTPEGKVKDVVKKYLKEKGIYYIMPATGGYGSSGAPDIVVCHKGKFYGLEIKSGANKPTALQMDNLNRIEENGAMQSSSMNLMLMIIWRCISHESKRRVRQVVCA
jgi:Holliday junction resolvase